MEAMIGYQHVVLIDAINTRDGVPGQVYRLGVDSLPGTMNTSSAHDANLATALHLGRLLGADLPEDEFIDVVAIEVEDVLTFKDEPTPPVSAAIPVAADLVMAVLAETHMPVKEG